MKKAKIVLIGVGLMAIVGGAFAFEANRITKRLFYKTTINGSPFCYTSSNLTSTTTTLATVPPPAGATGWYTTSLCTGPTVSALTIAD